MGGKGHFSTRGYAGDLLIHVKVIPHPYFKRDGFDIRTDKYINITKAIFGGSAKIDTLWGSQEIEIKPGTTHGYEVVLEGMGINMLPPN